MAALTSSSIASPRAPVPQAGGAAHDRLIHGQGTSEHAWRAWDGLAELAPVTIDQLAPHGARVVVVAPHPDDEVLGCGGALACFARAGGEVLVVGVTDGEGSHQGSTLWTPDLLAIRRRAERADGLRRLGVATQPIALELPDGGVTVAEDMLRRKLQALVRPGDVVFATWRFDGHPDHEAAGRAAAFVAAAVGCRCWEVPVWMWHWATPGNALVPWTRLRRLALDDGARLRKSHAVAAHASQLEPVPSERRKPVVPDWALARLLRPFEVFIDSEGSP